MVLVSPSGSLPSAQLHCDWFKNVRNGYSQVILCQSILSLQRRRNEHACAYASAAHASTDLH